MLCYALSTCVRVKNKSLLIGHGCLKMKERKYTTYSDGPPPFLTDWMTSDTSGRSLVEKRENTTTEHKKAHTLTHTHSKHTRGSGIFPLLLPGINHGRRLTFPSVWACVCVCVSGACVCCERIDPKDHATSYTLFPLVPKREKKTHPGRRALLHRVAGTSAKQSASTPTNITNNNKNKIGGKWLKTDSESLKM